MLRLVLPLALFCALSCSKEPTPTAPAGKSNCALCDILGEGTHQAPEGSGGHTAPEDDEADRHTESDSSSVASPDNSSPSDGVFIPNTDLRTILKAMLGKRPDETITQADMNTLQSFRLGSYSVRGERRIIDDIRGLETAKNLRTLSITENQVYDLTPLANLTKLESLRLDDNHISDITPLANLTKLQYLSLEFSQLSDLSPLENLAELRYLSLGFDQFSNVSLSPLANLTKLEELYLHPHNILAIPPVEKGTKRLLETSLIIFGWTFNTIPVGSSVNLVVTFDTSQLSDITPLANLTNLENLIIAYSQVSNITPLANLTNLENLIITYSQVSNITPLANLTNLEQLLIDYNQVSDITPLANLTNLEQLDLSVNQVSDITPLANLTKLEELYFTANQVSDITPLTNLTSLEQLYFGVNQVSNITPLTNLTNLEQLYFTANQVSDITPVKALRVLEELKAEDNPLSTTSINEHIPDLQLRGVDVSFSSVVHFPDTESPFRIDLVFLEDDNFTEDDFTKAEQEMWHRIANRWELVIQTELPDYEFSNTWTGQCGSHLLSVPAGEQIDNLRIYITKFDKITPYGAPVRGYGGPILLRSSSLPIIGCIGIDIATSTRFDDLLWEVGLHEVGHVLGIGTTWEDSGMLRELNSDVHFAGPQAIAAFDQAGGTDYQGAKVPTEPGGGHWHRSVLSGELMAPSNGDALSAITLQALSDLGYSVNLSEADPYVLPSPTAAKPVAEAIPFCSLEGLPPPVYVDD